MTVAGTVSALARRQLKAMRDVLDFKFECEPFEDRISGETVLRLWKPASSNGNAAAAALAHAKVGTTGRKEREAEEKSNRFARTCSRTCRGM